MTPEQIKHVQTTWRSVEEIGPQAARLFYENLFGLDPSLRPLFQGDMDSQGKKLITMITIAVNGLNRLEMIIPAVEKLGRRHVDYGVKPEHYDTVGTALLSTLEQGLGAAFSDEVKTAWTMAYQTLASTMKAAAYPAGTDAA
jgi:hemoglobin-like flavoprotein